MRNLTKKFQYSEAKCCKNQNPKLKKNIRTYELYCARPPSLSICVFLPKHSLNERLDVDEAARNIMAGDQLFHLLVSQTLSCNKIV